MEKFLGAKTRSFNNIDLNLQKGTLIKTSTNIDKFLSEIKWYLNIPSSLQYALPRIFDYSLNKTKPFIKMEYYSYKSLHELFIKNNLSLENWKQIFDILKMVNDEMKSFKTYNTEKIDTSLKEIYIHKTINRLNQLKSQNDFLIFFNNPIIYNNKDYYSLSDIINIISSKDFYDKNIKSSNYFNIIHGDLCFPNILIDNNLKFIKLIDPRGEFGSYSTYGDNRYELAKILHSIDGCYDFIIEDLFDIDIINNKINIDFFITSSYLPKLFKKCFNLTFNEFNEIKLIESLLFLSMIPLHSDNKNRQMTMLAIGTKLFYEAYNEYNIK